MYTNSIIKEATLEEMGVWNGDQWIWKLLWRREWFEWEKPMVTTLLHNIQRNSPYKEREDEWFWKGEDKQVYSVKSTYKTLQNGDIRQENAVFGLLWKVKALPTTQFFAWRVISNRVATYDNLQRRGVLLSNNNCVRCEINVESVSHLFFGCKVAAYVWKECDLWVGLSSVHHNIAASNFIQFELQGTNKNYNILWRCMWVAIIWCIWNQRNNIIFRNARVVADEVFTLAQLKSWSWIVYKNLKALFSYSY